MGWKWGSLLLLFFGDEKSLHLGKERVLWR